MTLHAYRGDRYLTVEAVDAWCREAARAAPRWARYEVVGTTDAARPIGLLTLGDHTGSPGERPAFWLDGGTHAAEWTGVMSAVYSASRWLEALVGGDEAATRWFGRHTIYILPCVSPDGMAAMMDGVPFLRSTLRPPPPGTPRVGLAPEDLDGDGVVRWMRWRHPAGPFVPDDAHPLAMRPRRVDDDPTDAWFVCAEGRFLEWDGHQYRAAPREHGLDLNRNFPGSWRPFQMFGMDGGPFPLSAPESRAMVDALAARPNVGLAVSNHTYTGALLTQPYRAGADVPEADIRLMAALGADAVRDTGYRLIKVHPDFHYDPTANITGVWADTLVTVHGIPAWTLELWDPFGHAGVPVDNPARFFVEPDPAVVLGLLRAFDAEPGCVPWRPHHHPQLGAVELGGLDPLRTVRNPPERLLAAECARGHAVADRIRRALPRLDGKVSTRSLAPGLTEITLAIDNLGYLGTACMALAEASGQAAPLVAQLVPGPGVALAATEAMAVLDQLDGWGSLRVGPSANLLYSTLGPRGHATRARWLVRGTGTVELRWGSPRAGQHRATVTVAP
jgi:hypothetical protein